MKSAYLIGFVAMGLLAFAASGNAAITVYHHTSGGVNPNVPLELPISASEPIVLNVHGGTAPTSAGVICVGGNGDEVCGVDVTIRVTDGSILGFSEASPQVVSHSPSSNEIRIVAVLAVFPPIPPGTPPDTDPFHLGTLTVDASNFIVNVKVTSGEAVAADGSIVSVPQDTIAKGLPEPTGWLMLTAGSAALAALGRRRSRLAKHRV